MTVASLPTLMMLVLSALAAAGLGVWASGVPSLSPKILPFGGGILIGICLFWIFPEVAGSSGLGAGAGWFAAGCAALWLIDRYVHPVCPSCSHTHDHDRCSTRLHGFATPLIAAAAAHSFLDGWSVAASWQDGTGRLGIPVLAGVLMHKIPEGLAFGVILRASLGTRVQALAGCLAAQAPMVAGGLLESALEPYLRPEWIASMLALAGGSLLYLGFHAVHGEWKRRGIWPAFVPACTGAAGAAALQQTVARLFSSIAGR